MGTGINHEDKETLSSVGRGGQIQRDRGEQNTEGRENQMLHSKGQMLLPYGRQEEDRIIIFLPSLSSKDELLWENL